MTVDEIISPLEMPWWCWCWIGLRGGSIRFPSRIGSDATSHSSSPCEDPTRILVEGIVSLLNCSVNSVLFCRRSPLSGGRMMPAEAVSTCFARARDEAAGVLKVMAACWGVQRSNWDVKQFMFQVRGSAGSDWWAPR